MTEQEFDDLKKEYPHLGELRIIDSKRPRIFKQIFEETIEDKRIKYHRIESHAMKWAMGKVALSVGESSGTMIFPFENIAEARNYIRKN